MRNMSSSLRATVNGNTLGANSACCRITFIEKLTNNIITQVDNVRVFREEAAFTASCSFDIINVNPSDPTDNGYYTPYRDQPYKVRNDWFKEIIPSKSIKVEMGYGSIYTTVFTGVIDEVNIKEAPEGSTLTVKARDWSAMLLDQQITSIDNGEKSYWLGYPIGATVTPAYLTHSDNEPDISEIFIDLCVRVGFFPEQCYVDVVGETTSIEFEEITYAEAIEQLKSLTGYDAWNDEEGNMYFKKPQNRDITTTDAHVTILDTVASVINTNDKTAIVPGTLVVRDQTNTITYVEGVDYDYFVDYENKSIYRSGLSSITANQVVHCSYSSVDFIFKNGVNIFTMDITLSHINMYHRIKLVGDGIESISTIPNPLWDGSVIHEEKMLTITNDLLGTQEQIDAGSARLRSDLTERYTRAEFSGIAIPWLQIRDIVQLIVYGTVLEAYKLTGIDLSYSATDGMTATYKSYHVAYVPG